MLLHKKEIKKIAQDVEQKGLTLVPLKLYFKGDKIKLLLGTCRGKKNYDKRESLKRKDEQINCHFGSGRMFQQRICQEPEKEQSRRRLCVYNS